MRSPARLSWRISTTTLLGICPAKTRTPGSLFLPFMDRGVDSENPGGFHRDRDLKEGH